MKEIKIDEDHLNQVVHSAAALVVFIEKECKKLADKKEDIFFRYMAFSRLSALIKSADAVLDIAQNAFSSGHNLHHPFICTKIAKSFQWGTIKLEEDPFFYDEESEKIGEDLVNKALKSIKETLKDGKEEH